MGSDIVPRFCAKLTTEGLKQLGTSPENLSPDGHELANAFLHPLVQDGNGSIEAMDAFLAELPERYKHETDKREKLMAGQVSLLGGYEWQDVGDPIDWHHAPKGDLQWPTHLSRHYWLLPLVEGWRYAGEPAYAQKVVDVLMDWTRRQGLGVPGLTWDRQNDPSTAYEGVEPMSEGFFPDYVDGPWTSLSAHSRVERWTRQFQLMWDAPAMTNEVVATLLLSLAEDHRDMMLSHPRSMNQFQGIATSLIHLGWWYPYLEGMAEAEAEGWRRIEHYARTEIYPDGSMAECSPNYAIGCLGRMFSLAQEGRTRGWDVPSLLDERIATAIRYFALIADPHGKAPRIAKGKNSVRDALRPLEEIYPNPEARFVISGGAEGTTPTPLSHAFDWAGHVVMRSNWTPEATWLFFEPGPRGSGHHDLACLNLQLQSHGEWLLTDPGFYTYSGAGEEGVMSKHLYSTAAHNTALVDGQGQIQAPRGTSRRANTEPSEYGWNDDGATARAEGVYSYGYGPEGEIEVSHRRRIVYERSQDTFLIEDTFEGEGEHEIALHWQAPPEAEMSTRDGSLSIVNGGAQAVLTFEASQGLDLSVHRGERDPHRGWFSDYYGQLEPAPQGVVKVNGPLPLTIRTKIELSETR